MESMKWIKVEDELPEEGQNVLIYAPYSKFKIYTGDYLHEKVRDCKVGWWVTSNFRKEEWDRTKSWFGDITHWMRIEPPA